MEVRYCYKLLVNCSLYLHSSSLSSSMQFVPIRSNINIAITCLPFISFYFLPLHCVERVALLLSLERRLWVPPILKDVFRKQTLGAHRTLILKGFEKNKSDMRKDEGREKREQLRDSELNKRLSVREKAKMTSILNAQLPAPSDLSCPHLSFERACPACASVLWLSVLPASLLP